MPPESDRTLSINYTRYQSLQAQIDAIPAGSEIDHNSLANLTVGNVHTQYLLAASPGAGIDVVSQIPSVKQLWTPYALCGGRLTLETGVPVSTTDQTAKTTLYLESLGIGGVAGLYDGSRWDMYSIIGVAGLSLSGYTTGKPYDIWLYNNAGAPTLDGTVWTNDTARATELVLQDGIYAKAGATTHRYLGTIYTSGTGTCEDSVLKRYVWNMYNRVPRRIVAVDSTASWTYGSAAWRQARAQASNRIEFVQGLLREAHSFTLAFATSATAETLRIGGIGINSTTSPTGYAPIDGTPRTGGTAHVIDPCRLGYNAINWLEFGSATGTVTFYGSGSVECLRGQVWG